MFSYLIEYSNLTQNPKVFWFLVEQRVRCQTNEEHVAMVGLHSIDEDEKKWLDEGTIHCMTMDIVKEQGLSACLVDAVNTVNQSKAGFGLTIDLDAIDPSQAPFVATPVDSGLDVDEHHRSNRRNSVAMVGTSKPRVWSPPEDRVAVQKLLHRGTNAIQQATGSSDTCD